MQPRVLVLAAGMLLASAMATPAQAICVVSTTPLNFGKYPPFTHEWIMSVGTISYTCVGPLPAGIKIAIGADDAGGVVRRVMKGGDAKLPYVLTLGPTDSVPWGDGSKGSKLYFNAHPPRNRIVTIPVYGRIAPGEPVPANQIFRDSVSVLAYY